MTLVLDLETDFVEVADFLRIVTVMDRDGNTAPVQHALRRALRRNEGATSDGLYRHGDVRWHLPKTEYPAEPDLGGVIVDEAAEWTILAVDRETDASRWKCHCRDFVISERLDTLIDIEAANYSRTEGGAHEPNWFPWKTGLRARIQPESADRTVEHGRKHMPTIGRVYLRERLPVTTNHRIKASDGTIWKVRGLESPERIDQLLAVLVEKTPWPLG